MCTYVSIAYVHIFYIYDYSYQFIIFKPTNMVRGEVGP